VWCGFPCSYSYVNYTQYSSSGGNSNTWEIVPVCSGCCTQSACDSNPQQWNATIHGSCPSYISGGGGWDDDPWWGWGGGSGGYGS
jgi:hypothetical protein